MKKKNDELSKKVNTDNVLSTVAECTASTNSNDIAGASALAEMSESLSAITSVNVGVSPLNVSYTWYALAYKNTRTKTVSLHFGIRLVAFAASDTSSWLLISLPEGFRPICNIENVCYTKMGSRVMLQALTNGLIQIVPLTAVAEGDVFVYHDTYLIS